jgi:hypothetical protein
MKSFALIAAAQAVKLSEPWIKSSLPDCPPNGATSMDMGNTHVTRYPYVGATCKTPAAPVEEAKKASEDATPKKPAAKAAEAPAADAAKAPAAEEAKAPVEAAAVMTLPDCPPNDALGYPATSMNNGQDHPIRTPYVGANCKVQVGDVALVMTSSATLPNCPPNDALGYPATSMNNGMDHPIRTPYVGANCKV